MKGRESIIYMFHLHLIAAYPHSSFAVGSEHFESYESWKSSFDTEDYQSDISDLLVSSQQVRSSHSQLVPARVSYGVFWMRYFYKVQRLQKVCVMYYCQGVK